MARQALKTGPLAQRWSVAADLFLACGIAPTLSVALGGISFGALLWRVAFAGFPRAASSTLLFASLAFGSVAAPMLWALSCSFAAKQARVPLVPLMRWHSLAYGGLLAYPVVAALRLGSSRSMTASAVALSLYAAGSVLAVARFDVATRFAVYAFVVTRAPLVLVAELSALLISEHGSHHAVVTTDRYLSVWVRWDAVHYIDIARHGYTGVDIAFFPLYPALIRICAPLIGGDVAAGLLISNGTLFIALVYLYRIARRKFDEGVARRAVLYMCVFPTALFFSSVYSESLFAALALAMFYHLEERRWLLAGFLGGLAALTRPEGVLLSICYIVEIATVGRSGWRSIKAPGDVLGHLAVGVLMIPAGLLAYMLLLALLGHDPLSFAQVQSHWHRQLAWPSHSIARSVGLIVRSRDVTTVASQSLDLAFALMLLIITLACTRRLRPSFSVFGLTSVLLPLSTSSLMSMPRFALTCFPIFIMLGIWGAKQWVHETVLLVSLPLLGLFTALYANWYWVA